MVAEVGAGWIRRAACGSELTAAVATLYGEAARAFDLMYLRPTPPGREGTALLAPGVKVVATRSCLNCTDKH